MSRHDFLQAGNFNLRMNLQSPSQISDGCGGFTKTWISQFDVWAKIVPLSASLLHMSRGDNSKFSHYIYVRKREGFKSGMRFVKGERTFLIETVQDPDETGRYWVCTVAENMSQIIEESGT